MSNDSKAATDTVPDYSDIRPYSDAEVPPVVARLAREPAVIAGLASFSLPGLNRVAPWAARALVSANLRWTARGLTNVAAVQQLFSKLITRLVDTTISDFTTSGFDALASGGPTLFVSNHRDIVLDPSLLNFALHEAGQPTVRVAVGDNLLANPHLADVMRLNKSFVVERSATGTKAVFKALSRTSSYIRDSLAEGESVWIAQAEGRAKDGLDRTDPALLKMLALAWRKEITDLRDFVRQVRLVPIAISYELDPCDELKAAELAVRAAGGEFEKAEGADFESIVRSLQGRKGRIHVSAGEPMPPVFVQAEALAEAIDEAIRSRLVVYPTHVEAARRLGLATLASDLPELPDVQAAFEARLAECEKEHVGYLLEQYANIYRSARPDGLNLVAAELDQRV